MKQVESFSSLSTRTQTDTCDRFMSQLREKRSVSASDIQETRRNVASEQESSQTNYKESPENVGKSSSVRPKRRRRRFQHRVERRSWILKGSDSSGGFVQQPGYTWTVRK